MVQTERPHSGPIRCDQRACARYSGYAESVVIVAVEPKPLYVWIVHIRLAQVAILSATTHEGG